jgi:hypothetical protein
LVIGALGNFRDPFGPPSDARAKIVFGRAIPHSLGSQYGMGFVVDPGTPLVGNVPREFRFHRAVARALNLLSLGPTKPRPRSVLGFCVLTDFALEGAIFGVNGTSARFAG